MNINLIVQGKKKCTSFLNAVYINALFTIVTLEKKTETSRSIFYEGLVPSTSVVYLFAYTFLVFGSWFACKKWTEKAYSE